jgi:hypothetical protein
MTQAWEILLERQEQRRKVAEMEGQARLAGASGDTDPVPFSLILYPDQISLNVPASTLGREFIARLTDILGPPKLEPTVKCSCDWGKGVTGAMLIVLWELPPPTAAPRLLELQAFLGSTPA